MKLFNKGYRHIIHAESHKPGAACSPQKVFTVSDELGAKLKKMYPRELENLDDATAKFNDPAPAVKAAAISPGIELIPPSDPAAQAEKEEAESLGVSVDELRKLKE